MVAVNVKSYQYDNRNEKGLRKQSVHRSPCALWLPQVGG